MKKTLIAVSALIMMLGPVACSDSETSKQEAPAAGVKTDAKSEAVPTSINIRYIDEDSLSAHYNLAKDFKEASIRAFSRLESAQQSKAKEIQTFGSQIESKMRSNGYLSEDSYNADVAKLNKMQESAQNYLGTLQRNTEMEMAQQQQQLMDSVQNYIKEYNKTKGYDAILFKAAGVYFNPALDITEEIVAGLNARYNKVQKSK
ncbi:MAG: OmpH family outer membrane protein [Muribaculaceae bacterium]|nr:OmpH family outer membrane protein [Muribaculaceae bacterium]